MTLNEDTLEQLRNTIERAGASADDVNLDRALSSVAPRDPNAQSRLRPELVDVAVFSALKSPPSIDAGGTLGIAQLGRDVVSDQQAVLLSATAYVVIAARPAAGGGLEAVYIDADGKEWRPGFRIEAHSVPEAVARPYAVMTPAVVGFSYPSGQGSSRFDVHFGPKTLMTADEHEANATHALHIAEALRARGVDAADVDVDAVMRGSDGDASLVFAASTYQEGAYDTVWPPVGVLLGVLEVTSGSLDVRVNGDPDKVPPGMYAVRADRPNKLRLEHALDPKKDLVVDASKHNALPDKVALKCACFLSCCVGDC